MKKKDQSKDLTQIQHNLSNDIIEKVSKVTQSQRIEIFCAYALIKIFIRVILILKGHKKYVKFISWMAAQS